LTISRPVVNETGFGLISGTPTQAGVYEFYLTVTYNREVSCPFKNPSDDRFRIAINPGVPKLTIGPEQNGVPVGTTGTAYALQMTATVPDAKTWTISSGTLPAGLAIGASDGLISGTPTAAGSSTFTVRAEINPQRVDTKTLTIHVRDPLTIAIKDGEELPASEVGVRFTVFLTSAGGLAPYTWALASGEMPDGFVLGSQGAIAGRPTTEGSYEFAVSVTDAEQRVVTYDIELDVAPRLAIATLALRPGKVGKRYRATLRSTGGVLPARWLVKRGPLPRGIRFNRTTGTLSGTPKKPGTYRVAFEIRDALGVVSRKSFRIKIAPAPKPRRR
jgi:hypothetical protein